MTKNQLLESWVIKHYMDVDTFKDVIASTGLKVSYTESTLDCVNNAWVLVCPINRTLLCVGGIGFDKLDWQEYIFSKYPIMSIFKSSALIDSQKISILTYYSRCASILADEVYRQCSANKANLNAQGNVVSLV